MDVAGPSRGDVEPTVGGGPALLHQLPDRALELGGVLALVPRSAQVRRTALETRLQLLLESAQHGA